MEFENWNKMLEQCNERIEKLERAFDYKGFKCYVILRSMGTRDYRCGYVRCPDGMNITTTDTKKICCHGGITYSYQAAPAPLAKREEDNWYIGFDCVHAFDDAERWTLEHVCEECKKIADQVLERHK